MIFTVVFGVSLMPVFRALVIHGMDDDALTVHLVTFAICALLGSLSATGLLVAAARVQSQRDSGRK